MHAISHSLHMLYYSYSNFLNFLAVCYPKVPITLFTFAKKLFTSVLLHLIYTILPSSLCTLFILDSIFCNFSNPLYQHLTIHLTCYNQQTRTPKTSTL